MTTDAGRAIEAILMVAQEPIDPHLLAQLLEIAPARVEEECRDLQAAYEAEDRGFELVKVAGGYRYQSRGDLSAYVERFVLEGQTARLSAAALETLAIVAYKQPLSRAQVAAIRGVNVDGVMRTLQQRGYIEELGKDPGPGQATLFGTSKEFLERLGLDRIEDLPPLADLFPSAEVMEALEQGLLVKAPEAPTPEAEPPAPFEFAPRDEAEMAADQTPPATDEPATDEPSTDQPVADQSAADQLPRELPPAESPPSGEPAPAVDPFEEPDRPEPELPAWLAEDAPADAPEQDQE